MTNLHVNFGNKEEPEKSYNCPEVPDRVRNIYSHLKQSGLLDHML